MKFYVKFLFLILSTISLGNSCKDKIDSPCDIKFKVIGYDSKLLQKQKESDNSDFNSVGINDSIKYNLLCISLTSQKIKLEDKICEPNIKLQGLLTGINIWSNNKYNDSHKAGESLNDIISVIYQNEDYKENENPILVKSLTYNQSNKLGYHFFLTEYPDSIRNHAFNIEISNIDTTFLIQTNTIIIKP